MQIPDTEPDQMHDHGRDKRSRIIDLRLPLPWLLTTAATISLALIGMYFQLRQVSEDVTDLKISVRSGNTQQSTVQAEISILKFRIENLESDKRSRP